jgi:type I restriction enzyme S subunit
MKSQHERYKPINSSIYKEAPIAWNKYRVKDTVDRNSYYPVGDGDHGSIKPEMYQEEGIPYIRVQNLTWHGEVLTDGIVCISEEVQRANKKSILYPDDILIAKTGATIGKIGLIPENIKEANTTSSVGKLTVDKTRFNPKYILYCFQSRALQDQIWLEASQKSAQPGFNIDDLIVFEFLAPDLTGQSKIAHYLDHQTAIIDQLISQKEKLIELLKEKRQAVITEAVTKGLNPIAKMKDSGIEWLGEVPEDWELKPLKHLATLKGRLGWKGLKAEEYVEIGYGFLSTPDIKNDAIDFSNINYITKERFLESPEIILEVGDVLLVKDGSTLGIVNIIKDLPIQSTVNSSIGIIRIIDKQTINPEYLFWLLRSDYIQNVLSRLKAGQGVPHLFQKDIKNFTLLIPPIKMQNEIIKFINVKYKSVNEIIDKEKVQIEKLKEYRQSIISEAVTGKIDVREWQPNEKQLA